MKLIKQYLIVICSLSIANCLYSKEIFSYKDWVVTTYDSDPSIIKYTTHGLGVWGHEFGFVKQLGSCEKDNLYISWSTTEEFSQLEKMSNQTVLFDLSTEKDNYKFALSNLTSYPLPFGDTYNIMLFTNFFPNQNFIKSINLGKRIIIKVNESDPYFQNFDIDFEEFSLEGYSEALKFSNQECKSKSNI